MFYPADYPNIVVSPHFSHRGLQCRSRHNLHVLRRRLQREDTFVVHIIHHQFHLHVTKFLNALRKLSYRLAYVLMLQIFNRTHLQFLNTFSKKGKCMIILHFLFSFLSSVLATLIQHFCTQIPQ